MSVNPAVSADLRRRTVLSNLIQKKSCACSVVQLSLFGDCQQIIERSQIMPNLAPPLETAAVAANPNGKNGQLASKSTITAEQAIAGSTIACTEEGLESACDDQPDLQTSEALQIGHFRGSSNTGRRRSVLLTTGAVRSEPRLILGDPEFLVTPDVAFARQQEEMVSPPQEETMLEVARLQTAIKNMKRQGDQQPMRDASKILRHYGLSFTEFASMDNTVMVDLIMGYAAHQRGQADAGCDPKLCRVPASFAEPKKLARRIKMSFFRLGKQFPDCGFPTPEMPSASSIHPYDFPEEGGPEILKSQLDRWTPLIHDQEPGSGHGAPLTRKTEAEYRVRVRQLVTLWIKVGGRVGPSLDLGFLTEAESIALWLPAATKHYNSTGISPLLASIKRVVADVLGKDHPNVDALSAARRKAFQKPDLSADKVEVYRDLTRPEAATSVCQIWDVPVLIDRLALESRLSPSDRDSRKSSAVAIEILLSTLNPSPQFLAAINLETDVRGKGEDREINCTDHAGRREWRPLSSKACWRIDELETFRRMSRRSSVWLFPRKNGQGPQERRVAMTALARHVSAVLSRRLKVSDLRDAIVVNMVDNGVNDPKLIGDLAGVDARTVERRFSVVLKAPLKPMEEAA